MSGAGVFCEAGEAVDAAGLLDADDEDAAPDALGRLCAGEAEAAGEELFADEVFFAGLADLCSRVLLSVSLSLSLSDTEGDLEGEGVL